MSVVCIYCRGEHGEGPCFASIVVRVGARCAKLEQQEAEVKERQAEWDEKFRKLKAKCAVQTFESYKLRRSP